MSYTGKVFLNSGKKLHHLVGGFTKLRGPIKHGNYNHCIGTGIINLKDRNLSFSIRLAIDGQKMVYGPKYNIKKTPGEPLMKPSYVIARVNHINKYDIEPLFIGQRVFAGEQKRFLDQADHEWMIPKNAIAFTLLPNNQLKIEVFSELGSRDLDKISGKKKFGSNGKFYVDLEVRDKIRCKKEENSQFEIAESEIDAALKELLHKAQLYSLNPRFTKTPSNGSKNRKALTE